MRVLITGGAGFLGSHLSDRLLSEGHEVVCVDNLLTGQLLNLGHIASTQFQFIHQDVTNGLNIEGSIDFVLHFASPASPKDYFRYPVQTLIAGSIGTQNALNLARAKNASFLLASTSEVYGNPLINPQSEDYSGNVNPTGPRSVYDEAKRYAEALTMAYHRVYGLDTRIVRIFNTFGPRMRPDDGRVVPTFIMQALENKPLTIFGSGDQTRSLIYVSDEVEGIFRLMKSGWHEPINIGNPEQISITDFAKMVIQLTNSSSDIVHENIMEDDPTVRCPDIRLAKRILDWRPVVSIQEGLIRTIEYLSKCRTFANNKEE